eukprot:g3773.t1
MVIFLRRDPWLALVGQKGELLPEAVEVSFQEYLQIRNATARNIFLFLRDEVNSTIQGSRVELRHRFFKALEAELHPPLSTDLRIFAMDGLAAGHGMHRHREAWLASLAGRKLWWVAPPAPSVNAPGRPSFPYKALTPEEGVLAGAGLEELVPNGVTRCVQHPGEAILLPADWWHMTCSLSDFNIAVGGQSAAQVP